MKRTNNHQRGDDPVDLVDPERPLAVAKLRFLSNSLGTERVIGKGQQGNLVSATPDDNIKLPCHLGGGWAGTAH